MRTTKLLGLGMGLFLLAGCGAVGAPYSGERATVDSGNGGAPWMGSSDASAFYADVQSTPSRQDAGLAVSDAGLAVPDVGAQPDVQGPRDAAEPTDASVGPDGGEDAAVETCEALTDRSPVTMYLSSDDSNSVASPVILRRQIRMGSGISAHLIRTHEFLNYYNPTYEAPQAGRLRVVPQLRTGATPASWEFTVGLQSETRTLQQVRPMVLTFVLDTSGSMGHGQRIERERAVVRAIAGQLRRGDVVNAVTWNTDRRVVLSGHMVSGPNDPAVVAMANNLQANGGTDLEGGIRNGYALANSNYNARALNRVVLISDGEANVGITDENLIAQHSHRAEGDEIYLVGVGVGDGFNDTLMDTITDRGRGAYIFIDSDEEANVMFGRRFVENMDLALRAVRLELTLPWYLRVQSTSAEQISTNPRMVDPQHLAPNDAMVFHQTLRACSATIAQPTDEIRVRATYEDRDSHEARSEAMTTTVGALREASATQLLRARAVVAYAEALKRTAGAAFGEAAQREITNALQLVAEARQAQDDAGLQEIEQLLRQWGSRFGLSTR